MFTSSSDAVNSSDNHYQPNRSRLHASTSSVKSERSREVLQSLSFEYLAEANQNKDQTTSSTNTTTMGGCFAKDNEELKNPRDVESQREGQRRSQSRRGRSRSQSSRRSRSQRGAAGGTRKSDSFDDNPDGGDYYTMDELIENKLYVLQQDTSPLSTIFSVLQTLVLLAMMIQCSVAPLNINPMIGPYPDALDYWGGKNAYKILNDNEYYRLITPIMLHGGILHLLGNVSVQMDNGALYEKEWGSGIWAIVYLTSGIGSSLFSCCFMPDNISVGSSGAVMGLFGAKLAEVFCRACESDKTKQGRVGHIVRNEQCSESLCAVTLVMLFSFVPFIDWAAHLGGLLAGFCAGMICFSCWIKTYGFRLCWFVIGVTLTVGLYASILAYFFTSVNPRDDLNDICGLYQGYFEDYECNCQLDD